MGYAIVKQPNGLFACYESYTDDFIFINATKEEFAEKMAKMAYEETLEKFEGILSKESSNGYKMASKSWEDALETIRYYQKGRAKALEKECSNEQGNIPGKL